jgi:hypothetical protein
LNHGQGVVSLLTGYPAGFEVFSYANIFGERSVFLRAEVEKPAPDFLAS